MTTLNKPFAVLIEERNGRKYVEHYETMYEKDIPEMLISFYGVGTIFTTFDDKKAMLARYIVARSTLARNKYKYLKELKRSKTGYSAERPEAGDSNDIHE